MATEEDNRHLGNQEDKRQLESQEDKKQLGTKRTRNNWEPGGRTLSNPEQPRGRPAGQTGQESFGKPRGGTPSNPEEGQPARPGTHQVFKNK